MKLPLVLDPRAHQQLRDSCRWWAENRSAEQAQRWYNGFSEALLDLQENAERWPLAPENQQFPIEVRQLLFGLGNKPTHRALFTIRPDMVYVFTIRHASQESLTPGDL